jgi:hypothetical protein
LSCVLLAACSSSAGVEPRPSIPQAVAAPVAAGAVEAAAASGRFVTGVPFYAQRTNHCGPAALAMALGWSGMDVAPDALAASVYTDGRQGSLQSDLITAARRRGRIAYPIHGIDELEAALDAGIPSIVLQNLGLRWWPRWHYAVALGIDRARAEAILHTGATANRRVSLETFDNTWSRAGQWGLLVLPPDLLPAFADEQRWIDAALGLEQARRWRAAALAYGVALDRWPDSLAAAVGLGNALYAVGEFEASQAAFQIAVDRHARAAPAWNNLAHVLARRGRHQEALDAAHRAVAAGGPDSEVYRRTLSEIEAQH